MMIVEILHDSNTIGFLGNSATAVKRGNLRADGMWRKAAFTKRDTMPLIQVLDD